ncbi:UNVERIFIED_CONTAM: hypothetical protein GTU68_038741 [Idotea baltica]|nr:hypothetical protein [Idotea baltica]
MSRLRDRDTGCAWDIEQTFASIAPYTIEEAYEVADAIARNNLPDLQDELGDLLLQVVFHAQMASEQNKFNFDDVANGIIAKLIRRHPHIFGDTKLDTPEAVKAAWENVKAQERAAEGVSEDNSALAGIALALPALLRANKIQSRAARVGFDWPDVEPVWAKLDEEIAEVREAIVSDDARAVEDEIGDLLFTVVNLARHLDIDPEVALTHANAKFEKRFRQVEELATAQGSQLADLELAKLDALWDVAKKISEK